MADQIVKFGDWISGGWELFARQWQTWVLAALMWFILVAIPMVFLMVGIYIPLLTRHEPDFVVLVPLIFIMPFVFVGAIFISGGMHRMALKQLRGQQISFRDVFSCKDCFGRLLVASFLGGLLVSCGYMLCILPAFAVLAFLFFTQPLIIDRNMSAIDAMKTSYEFVKKDWLMFTLFVFVTMIIAQAGGYFCYIGMLATYPLLFTINAVAYRDCFGMEGVQTDRSNTNIMESPGIYSPPPAGANPTNRFIAACPSCNAYMPVSATFCPKCGMQRK